MVTKVMQTPLSSPPPFGATAAPAHGEETKLHARGRVSHFYSLRTKLLIAASALVVVPGMIFALLAFSSARRALEASIGRQLAEVAHDAADDIETQIDAAHDSLIAWARQEVMRDLLVGDVDKRVSRFLASLHDSNSAYQRVRALAIDGTVIAASRPEDVGRAASGSSWLAAVSAGDDVFVAPKANAVEPTILLVTPIRHPDDARRVIGALALDLDWEEIDKILERLRGNLRALGAEIDLVVVDGDGAPINAIGRTEVLALVHDGVRAAHWDRLADRLQRPGREGFVYEPAAAALVGFAPLELRERGWTALAIQPASEAFAPVAAMLRRWILALALIFVLAGMAAMVMARRMVRPLQHLTAATRVIGAQAAPAPVRVETRDEIGELARSFNAMSLRLDRAQRELLNAAKFALIGELAAGIAHEVRTPLSVLRSSAQVLARSLPDASASQIELAEGMIEEVDRLDRVIEGLLQLARPQLPRLEPTDLNELLARACDFTEHSLKQKRIALAPQLAAGLPPALCDGAQIYQVALNLLVNATHFAPPGSEVTVRTLGRDGLVGFEIVDHGPGISAEAQQHIFTPFYTTRPGGTGLGLALVDRIVKSHQGAVTVRSQPGRGAAFRVMLPIAAEES